MSNHLQALAPILCLLVCAVTSADAPVRLSVDGWTEHLIVIPDAASVEVQAAAAELCMHLEQVCPRRGALYYDWIEIVPVSRSRAKKCIFVGRSKALEELGLDIDWEALGDDGFVIRTAGPHLVIAGGPRRGTINGVYTFLEEVVGVRWFTPAVTHIPHKPKLSVGPLDIRHVPVFDVRATNAGLASDVDWSARQRLNLPWGVEVAKRLGDGVRTPLGLFVNDPKQAGCGRYVGGSHTLGHDGLVPVSAFEQRPDYFALIDGKRDPHAQPCLTNPDFVPFVVAGARRWLDSDPGATVISISLGDFAKFCSCGPCKASMNAYGRSGYVLRFVNEVAAGLEQTHPDILVSTLAYHWFTRTPPTKHIDVHPNVVIRFAPIYASSHQAYDEGAYNLDQKVHAHLLEWIRIAPRVWVWAYFLAEADLHPFATFNCLNRNFKLFRDAGVRGFTLQADGAHGVAGGLTELQAYLLAKMMWNPDYNVPKGIEEFCRGVYGAAAPRIIRYVEQVNDVATYDATLSAKRKHSNFEPLKPEKMIELDRLLDAAERDVADDPDVLERVRFVRLGLQYAIISHASDDAPIRAKAIRSFFPVARRAGIRILHSKKAGKTVRLDALEKSLTGTE